MSRLACALAFVLTVVAASRPCRADDAAARAHFQNGVGLYDKKSYTEALGEFRAAYAEKPSAGIKQNIALCLEALGRSVEAATAFDEALDEGKDSLKPSTRSAIERKLEEVSKSVATVHLEIVGADGQPLEGAVVTVDGHALAPEAVRRPIRLPQGIHTLTAHVEGLPDPPPKKLALLLGQPVDATFVVAGGQAGAEGDSALTVRANVSDATIRLDGVDVARGSWSGKVPSGSHAIEISAPDYRTAKIDVTVPAGATIDYPVFLTKEGEAPGPYDHVDRKPAKPKRFYVVPALMFEGESFRLSGVLDEPPDGTRRSFSGVAFGARGGFQFSKLLSAEADAEFGVLYAKYKTDPLVADSTTTIQHWQLTPMLRLTTPGTVRFTMGTGFGVHGNILKARIARGASTVDKKGSGVGFSWLIDAGLQIVTGPVFLEGAAFFDVHGVGAVRDSESGDRFLQASPATRIGARFGVGIPF